MLHFDEYDEIMRVLAHSLANSKSTLVCSSFFFQKWNQGNACSFDHSLETVWLVQLTQRTILTLSDYCSIKILASMWRFRLDNLVVLRLVQPFFTDSHDPHRAIAFVTYAITASMISPASAHLVP